MNSVDPNLHYDYEDSPRFWRSQEYEKQLIEKEKEKYDNGE